SLRKRDAYLLENETGERCVVAKFGAYLSALFKRYDVDVEYNRQAMFRSDAKTLPVSELLECRQVKKLLEAQRLKTEMLNAGILDHQKVTIKNDVRVFPDIIVHRRGIPQRRNLLVIEVKRETNKESRKCDKQKIEAMRVKYRYKYGLFIELPSGPGAAD